MTCGYCRGEQPLTVIDVRTTCMPNGFLCDVQLLDPERLKQ